MRFVSFLIGGMALLAVGCGHSEHKADAPASSAKSAPAATKTTAAKTADSKSKATSDPSDSTKVECFVKGDERILEVRAKDSGCELAYTKAGKEGIVASASHGTEYCQKALDKLADKLKGAGYECK